MTREQLNKIKLYENEVVHCNTLELAFKCCVLAHKLDLKYSTNKLFINLSDYSTYKENTCYDFVNGTYSPYSFFQRKNSIITAEEWLNRHDIFLFGQDVHVSDGSKEHSIKNKLNKIYLVKNNCVMDSDTECFKLNKPYRSYYWKFITSTHKPFEPYIIREVIEVDGKTYYKDDLLNRLSSLEEVK